MACKDVGAVTTVGRSPVEMHQTARHAVAMVTTEDPHGLMMLHAGHTAEGGGASHDVRLER